MLVDCISGLPLYEVTTPANVTDASVAEGILAAANAVLPLRECTFLADKGYDVRDIYNTVKDVYEGEAFIPLNKRGTKDPRKLAVGNPICEAGLAMHKDGKTSDGHGGLRQKYCCPFRQSKSGDCPCNHKCWNNGRKNRAAPNTNRFQTITGALLTETACVSSVSTRSEQSASGTTRVSRTLDRNGSGFIMRAAPPI